jgi:hypothetical protein
MLNSPSDPRLRGFEKSVRPPIARFCSDKPDKLPPPPRKVSPPTSRSRIMSTLASLNALSVSKSAEGAPAPEKHI